MAPPRSCSTCQRALDANALRVLDGVAALVDGGETARLPGHDPPSKWCRNVTIHHPRPAGDAGAERVIGLVLVVWSMEPVLPSRAIAIWGRDGARLWALPGPFVWMAHDRAQP